MKSDDYFIRSEDIKDIHGIRVLNQAAFVNGENEARLFN